MTTDTVREWTWIYEELFFGLHAEPDGGIDAMIEKLEKRSEWLEEGQAEGRCIDVERSNNYILIRESPTQQWEYVTTSKEPESIEDISEELERQAEWLREGKEDGGHVEYEGRNDYALLTPLN